MQVHDDCSQKNKWQKCASTDLNVLTFNELSYPSYPIKIKEIKIFGAISDLPAKKQNICMYFGQIGSTIYQAKFRRFLWFSCFFQIFLGFLHFDWDQFLHIFFTFYLSYSPCELQLLRLWTKSCIKGQLNSEWIYEVIVSRKMQT